MYIMLNVLNRYSIDIKINSPSKLNFAILNCQHRKLITILMCQMYSVYTHHPFKQKRVS